MPAREIAAKDAASAREVGPNDGRNLPALARDVNHTTKSAPISSQSGMTTKDEAILLVRLCRVDQQRQGHESQQESVASEVGQSQDAQGHQPHIGDQEPIEELPCRTFTGAQVAKGEVDADVDDVGVKQTTVPRNRVEYADGDEESWPPPSASSVFFSVRKKNRPRISRANGAYCTRIAATSTASTAAVKTTRSLSDAGRTQSASKDISRAVATNSVIGL